MSPRKPPRAPRLPVDIVRSPAAECLADVSAVGDEPEAVEVRHEDQNIWPTQKLMATLCGVDVGTVSEHLRGIFETTELEEGSAVRVSRIAAADGKSYDTQHYGRRRSSPSASGWAGPVHLDLPGCRSCLEQVT